MVPVKVAAGLDVGHATAPPLARVPLIAVPAATAVPWFALTVYVPAPPVPVPSAVMVVPRYTPVPAMAMPTASAPEVTAVTVSVDAVMPPVTTAAIPPVSPAVVDEKDTCSPATRERVDEEESTLLPRVTGEVHPRAGAAASAAPMAGTAIALAPVATVMAPRVLTVTAHVVAQLVALGEIRNVFDDGVHTNVGVVTRVAASVGHPAPVIERALPDCEKKSRVPAVCGGIPVAVKALLEMPLTGCAKAAKYAFKVGFPETNLA